jgi:hypothetical protein
MGRRAITELVSTNASRCYPGKHLYVRLPSCVALSGTNRRKAVPNPNLPCLPQTMTKIMLTTIYDIQLIQSAISSIHAGGASSPFIERFKYTVISSSLLAPSLPTPHPCRSPRCSPNIPGKLFHSGGSALDVEQSITLPPIPHSEPSYAPISFAAGLAAVSFSVGYPFLFLVSVMATLLLYFNFNSRTETSKHDMTSVGILFPCHHRSF